MNDDRTWFDTQSINCIIKIKVHSSCCEIEDFFEKLIFASCVWYSDRAYYWVCVLIKDIGRRLPLQLQCSYQGQQGDVSKSVRGNNKTRFEGDKIWQLWKEMHQFIKCIHCK